MGKVKEAINDWMSIIIPLLRVFYLNFDKLFVFKSRKMESLVIITIIN